MAVPTRFITDSQGGYKLKVSLPGGRYQFTLDDSPVIFLINELGYEVRDIIPSPFVPVFVAMGDAWLPRQKDVDSVLEDLHITETLTANQRGKIREYATTTAIPPFTTDRVLQALESIGIDSVEEGDLNVNSVDVDIEGIFGSSGPKSPQAQTDSNESEEAPHLVEEGDDSIASAPKMEINPGSESQVDRGNQSESIPAETERTHDEESLTRTNASPEAFKSIPGIGPKRAESIAQAGVPSIEALAEMRPVDLTTVSGMSEGLATVAIEGARTIVGSIRPMEEQLSVETGEPPSKFESALNSLAAAGVPASEAGPELRVLFGPTVAELEPVTGAQAYHLWEAGYQTPKDLVDASIEELTEVRDIGDKTAPEIKSAAEKMLSTFGAQVN